MRLKGKVALVTGAARGMGHAISELFAKEGAIVVAGDITAAEPAYSKGVEAVKLDVTSEDDWKAVVAATLKKHGHLDVLVNNAGIGGPTAPVHEMDPADWDAVLRVNLTGCFDVTQNAIPHLIRAGKGVIINMASAAGRFGYANRSPYSASKWAVIGFTRTLSMELGQYHIRVNAIAPGAVAGERAERVFQGRAQVSGRSVEEEKRLGLASQSLKELVDPKDIAQLALFLASDAAKSISGQVLPIDGDMQRA